MHPKVKCTNSTWFVEVLNKKYIGIKLKYSDKIREGENIYCEKTNK